MGCWTRSLIAFPHALAVNSTAVRGELIRSRLIAPKRVFLLPNAVRLSEFNRNGNRMQRAGCVQGQECTAILVGRLVPVKCVHRFVQALALARRKAPNLVGAIVGEGPELPALTTLASELKLSDVCQFLGARSDVPTLLKHADMLVLCSDDEGLPNVILEAMAAGLPVVSTPAGDAKSVVRDGSNGFVVPFHSVEQLADGMVRLEKSVELRHRFGEAGRSMVEQDYNFHNLPRRLFRLYQDIALQHGDNRVLASLQGWAKAGRIPRNISQPN
jgi:glycosyltransferase involved in cell wall biosynthesis